MPTEREIVANRPLAGYELKRIILNDLSDQLDLDGILSGHMAFGRCSYEVKLLLHLDNPSYPEHVNGLKSVRRPKDILAVTPELESVETPPLTEPSENALFRGSVRVRKIVSPNKVRVENGLPLTINARNSEGHIEEKQVTYKPEEAGLQYHDPLEDTETMELGQAEVAAELGTKLPPSGPVDAVALAEAMMAAQGQAEPEVIVQSDPQTYSDPVAMEAQMQRDLLDAAVEGQEHLADGQIEIKPNETKEI